MTSKTSAFIKKHRSKTPLALLAFGASLALLGTTALLGSTFVQDDNAMATGKYNVANGDGSTSLAATLAPGSSDSMTLNVINDGDFDAVYGLTFDTKAGSTHPASLYEDVDVTLSGAMTWSGTFAELQTLRLVDTTGIEKGTGDETVTITFSVDPSVTNPAFGVAGLTEFVVNGTSAQTDGGTTPEMLQGLTGTGDTKVKTKS